MKKHSSSFLLTALALVCGAALFAQTTPPAKKQPAPPLPGAGTGGATPHYTTSTVIGPNRKDGSRVTISYGRPTAVHPRTGGEPRKIWGGLVKWDKADRLGADEATLIVTQHAIQVGSTTVPAGAYTLYIVPSENGVSKLAFSKKIGDWGVPVDETADLARFDLKKTTLSESVDQLTIKIENEKPPTMNGVINIMWEKTQFSLPFTVKK
ncbi:MAG: DUF2911 domain-containing protein [Opitutaceae bacterium]